MKKGIIESLSYAVRGRVVLKYFGQFCIVAGILISVSLLVAFLGGEFDIALRYVVIVLALLVVGFFLDRLAVPRGIQINEALALTSLVFIVMPLLLTHPLMGAGLPFVDAFFEAVSGMTTTGLSTLASVEDKPPSFLFTRAWLQWSGGLGIVVLTVALILGPGTTAARQLVDFADSDDLIGSTKHYARRILIVYVLLTIVGFLVIMLAGVAPFPALVHGLAAISTGGFSSYDRSLGAIGGWATSGAVMAVSTLGAIPLALYYKSYRDGFSTFFKDIQLRVVLILTALSTTLLWIFMSYGPGGAPSDIGGHAIIMALSAQTTTGFSTLAVAELGSSAKLVMILSMLIGGGIGSTAGGIKVLRLIILWRILKLTLVRTSLPPHAVLEPRLTGSRLGEEEINRSLLLIILFVAVIFISWLPFVFWGYDPLDSLFEVVSATGTVGLSTGITAGNLPDLLKMVLCADMLMGRLEIIAILVLFYPRTWRGRRM
ncbi:MAG: potassium transporter TrkG [Desulfurivibrionaceae bacterium]|nr:potassium transporter TrkG [Desulfobulbales bacterium]MDT8334370.1 potassium transporter TrkG [Desulfurivibrionaceae bacterium]